MEQKQITLNEIYRKLLSIERALQAKGVTQTDDKRELTDEFTEEENHEFIEGTKQAWKEIDEGKGKKMSVEEFINEIRSLKQNA